MANDMQDRYRGYLPGLAVNAPPSAKMASIRLAAADGKETKICNVLSQA